ncbi:MAG: hypothetical protein Q8R92_14985, partial [Deltaproteobacteria bacterium]|nr:hypothetical protein [Deltaproteobacteria bacterium]
MMRKNMFAVASILVVLAVLLATLDVFFVFYGRRYPFMFRHRLDPQSITEEGARRFLESAWFDPRLGWDSDPVARNQEEGRTYWAQSYGDSFTYGAEVEEDATWQAAHFRATGRRILNLGVSGYGLDQAVLKFEKYGERFPTERAILALNSQEYRRVSARYAYYCFASVDLENLFKYAFKPIYRPSADGWELQLPPCRDPACLIELLRDEPGKLRALLSQGDVCYRQNDRRPFLQFPYTLNF